MSDVLANLTTLASGKVRLVQKLIEGDPIAWSIVGAAIGIVVIILLVQRSRNKGQPAASDQRDEPVKKGEPRV